MAVARAHRTHPRAAGAHTAQPPGTERPPRPFGVAPGLPWEPREGERNHAAAGVVVRFVEYLDEHPEWAVLGAGLLKVWARLFVHDDGVQPADVPNEPGSWKFAAVGDFGAGTVNEARVATNIGTANPDLVITVGDNVYPTGRWQDYAKNFDPAYFYGDLVHRFPFMPSLGNHDLYRDDLRPYFEHFPHLKGRPYYAFTFRNAHFMALDADQDLRIGSAQRMWLERELARSTSTFRVIYFHYPLFGRNPNAFAEIRDSLQPLFRRYHVQLVITGHEHNYQRTLPIDGTTYVIGGNGGQQVYPFAVKREPWTVRRKAVWGHVEISVGPSRMVSRAYDEHGTLIDTAVIPSGGADGAATGAALVRVSGRAARARRTRRR